MTTDRKPTATERGVAEVVRALVLTAVVAWLVWGPWWMYHCPPPYDRERDAFVCLAAMPGCIVLLVGVFTFIIGSIGMLYDWTYWALTTPVAKPAETFETIDEGRF